MITKTKLGPAQPACLLLLGERVGVTASFSLTSSVTLGNQQLDRKAFHQPSQVKQRAFTLIEVMVACGIFFMATFAILALVAGTLRNARGLQKGYVDAGMAASQVFEIFKTNRDPDLSVSGDFGESLREYSWSAASQEYDTNGLLQVEIVVNRTGSHDPIDRLIILVYQANARSSALGSPRFR